MVCGRHALDNAGDVRISSDKLLAHGFRRARLMRTSGARHLAYRSKIAAGIWKGRPRRRVRICANRVVTCVRLRTVLPNVRRLDTHQFASAQEIVLLEGLAVAIPRFQVLSRSAFALRARPRGSSPPFLTRATSVHCFNPACHFNTIVIGEDGVASVSAGELRRNRPSGLTS